MMKSDGGPSESSMHFPGKASPRAGRSEGVAPFHSGDSGGSSIQNHHEYPGEVHVWHRPLSTSEAEFLFFQNLLSIEERERAERICSVKPRHDYVVGRGTLRWLLGQYLRTAPAHIRLSYTANGKPLLSARHLSHLNFNLSHARDRLLIGIAWNQRIGIDLEYCDERLVSDALTGLMLSETESEIFRTLPLEQRIPAFYRGWTSKEAFVKATGEVFSRKLRSFDVSLDPRLPARLLRADGISPSAWHFHSLDFGDGYQGTLAIEGTASAIRLFRFPQYRPVTPLRSAKPRTGPAPSKRERCLAN